MVASWETTSHVTIPLYNHYKVQPENESIDVINKWKCAMLFKEYRKYINDNDLNTEEMEKAKNHLYKLNILAWLSIPVFTYLHNILLFS